MEIRINGKLAGANWADDFMTGISEEVGELVAEHVWDVIPEGANVHVAITDEKGNEVTGRHADDIKRGIEAGLMDDHN